MYITTIIPVLTYGSETWTLPKLDTNFERDNLQRGSENKDIVTTNKIGGLG